jgi:tryptophan synthase beta chain
MDCKIYMGAIDVKRQELNVFRMRSSVPKLSQVTDGSSVLKDAVNAALRAWLKVLKILIISLARQQALRLSQKWCAISKPLSGVRRGRKFLKKGKLPAAVVACVGGSSNAAGLFYLCQ